MNSANFPPFSSLFVAFARGFGWWASFFALAKQKNIEQIIKCKQLAGGIANACY